jgi:hypothetical protein
MGVTQITKGEMFIMDPVEGFFFGQDSLEYLFTFSYIYTAEIERERERERVCGKTLTGEYLMCLHSEKLFLCKAVYFPSI